MIERLARVLGMRVEQVPDLPPRVHVIRSAAIPALGGVLSGMPGPAAAVTLGSAIIVHPDVRLSKTLLLHELEHVRQWRERPIVFPFLYVWHHFRHGYEANPFEVEARAAERARKGGQDES